MGWLLEPALVFGDDPIDKKRDRDRGMLDLNQEHDITFKKNSIRPFNRKVFGMEVVFGSGNGTKP